MGLKSNNSGVKFVSITGGKLTIRVQTGTPDSVERVLTAGKNEGKTISELRYDSLSGRIVGLKYDKKEFGEYVEVTIMDDEKYVLQIPWNSSLKNSLLCRLPNVDYNKDVTFVTFKDKDKDRAVLIIYQDEDLIAMAHTKDKPNGMPEAKKVTERGVEKWDFSDVEEFLYGVLQAEKERLEALNN